jgi:photosystem II stability/assembly factor-like uncharacterized protein
MGNKVKHILIILSLFLFSFIIISCAKKSSDDSKTSTDNTTTTSSGLFVAVGDNGIILTSSDASTWTTGTSGTTDYLKGGVTYINSVFMTVGDNGTILSSTDSTSWNQINSGTTENLREIKYLNGLYLIVGKNRIIL